MDVKTELKRNVVNFRQNKQADTTMQLTLIMKILK